MATPSNASKRSRKPADRQQPFGALTRYVAEGGTYPEGPFLSGQAADAAREWAKLVADLKGYARREHPSSSPTRDELIKFVAVQADCDNVLGRRQITELFDGTKEPNVWVLMRVARALGTPLGLLQGTTTRARPDPTLSGAQWQQLLEVLDRVPDVEGMLRVLDKVMEQELEFQISRQARLQADADDRPEA